MRKSLKKSAGKKTPQRDTMDVDDGEFTGLTSRSKDSPKPAGSQVCDALATPGGNNFNVNIPRSNTNVFAISSKVENSQ